ncbi:MAG: dienelactone hydrolase family protein [Burkholderiales bacterium]|nr:dienelactone hydrolase family protein [Burkholderiales bacterium]
MHPYRTIFRIALIALLLTASHRAIAEADDSPALDMREQVVQIDVTTQNLYNRQLTSPMPITIFRPAGNGPFPLAILNHGRAINEKRADPKRFRFEPIARYLVGKGFVVLVPTRIGYGASYGSFDPEDAGSCKQLQFAQTTSVATGEVLATLAYARTLPYVNTARWIVAGISVGGLVTLTTVAQHPPGLVAGINFSGGMGGDPAEHPRKPCSEQGFERFIRTAAKDATAPVLWLYWRNDQFWGEQYPKDWFANWLDGGGRGALHQFDPVGNDGHTGMHDDMDHWLPVVDEFLNGQGFTQAAIVDRPAPSHFAALNDTAKAPFTSAQRTGYQRFLAAKPPRAFAISESGSWGYAVGDYAAGKAMGFCLHYAKQGCRLYAVDDDVVWRAP